MSVRRLRAVLDGASAFTIELDLSSSAGPRASVSPQIDDAGAQGEAKASNAWSFALTPLDGASVRVREDDAPRSQAPLVHVVVESGGAVWTFVDGDSYRIEIDDAARAARAPRGAVGDEGLSAPMPATVIKLLVQPGQTVAHGDVLLLLEAMKMELPVRAPRDARVKALHCQAGDLVQPGVPLVDLESA